MNTDCVVFSCIIGCLTFLELLIVAVQASLWAPSQPRNPIIIACSIVLLMVGAAILVLEGAIIYSYFDHLKKQAVARDIAERIQV